MGRMGYTLYGVVIAITLIWALSMEIRMNSLVRGYAQDYGRVQKAYEQGFEYLDKRIAKIEYLEVRVQRLELEKYSRRPE